MSFREKKNIARVSAVELKSINYLESTGGMRDGWPALVQKLARCPLLSEK
jgi:hypothetical protein